MAEISHKEVAPGVVAITLEGKLMIGTATGSLVDVVESLVSQGTRKIILDLSGVPNIDSTWIGQIIAAYGKVAEAGGDMRIAGATGHVFQSFHISQLDKVFQFRASVDDAIKD
jgi:anti-sigma B factor antagonist